MSSKETAPPTRAHTTGSVQTGAPVPQHVVVTLIGFSLAMLLLPISCFKITTDYFSQSTTVAAIVAVVAANIILAGFIVVAVQEDKTSKAKTDPKKTN